MVNKSFYLFTCIILSLVCNFPISGYPRTVNQIVINEIGQTLDTYKDGNDEILIEQCKKFKPTVKQAALFFSKADPIPGVILMHERDSPCYAKGSIIFGDGLSGEWILYSGGTARLDWTRGGTVYLMHKQNKWHDPFACSYGLNNEGEC